MKFMIEVTDDTYYATTNYYIVEGESIEQLRENLEYMYDRCMAAYSLLLIEEQACHDPVQRLKVQEKYQIIDQQYGFKYVGSDDLVGIDRIFDPKHQVDIVSLDNWITANSFTMESL